MCSIIDPDRLSSSSSSVLQVSRGTAQSRSPTRAKSTSIPIREDNNYRTHAAPYRREWPINNSRAGRDLCRLLKRQVRAVYIYTFSPRTLYYARELRGFSNSFHTVLLFVFWFSLRLVCGLFILIMSAFQCEYIAIRSGIAVR